ncbi:MAG: DNRLRE domain-containing protein [Firmicutes bacterium]|nr:DNRLRE domain-containing protein [Bacillota bacterium]
MPTIFLPARGNTFVYQFRPYQNYSRHQHLSVGRDFNGSLGYTLINFRPQSVLPANATILNAQLLLRVQNVKQTDTQATFKVCRIISNWNWRWVTWRTCPEYDSNPLQVFPTPSTGLLNLDLTSLVQKWHSGEYAPLGLMILGASNLARGTFFQIHSTNAPNSDYWPQLMIEYTLPQTVVAPPTFVNSHGNITVPANDTRDMVIDVSDTRIMTAIVTNEGPSSVSAHLEISADGINYVSSSAPRLVQPADTTRLVADVFARYLRVVITNTTDTDTRVIIYCQGQIG